MDAVKDQSAGTGNTAGSKLRYPLRSATKLKEDASTTSSASKRGRVTSNVSKSVSVLDLSGKEKSAKPPRRLSIPAKSSISPHPRAIGTITPISETRVKRSNGSQGKSGTPVSDVSKSLNQRKFSILSSASYWLSQIKLSESAAKHSISIGFFKLALESGCEPLQRMRDELKAYAQRHNLVELAEHVNELLKSYNIPEDLEQLQVSETCSLVPEGTQSTDEDVNSSTSTTRTRKLKPKSLNCESFQSSPVADSAKEGTKKGVPAKNRVSSNKNTVSSKSVTDTGGDNLQKKPQRVSSRQKANKEKETIQNQENKSGEEIDPVEVLPAEDKQEDDKENMDALQMEERSLTEVV
ncbi:hypothetical protein BVC80_9097g139 [Macleaya cordata]|uniref:Uncharacterized protein n=1 Tax=Macleaya cordata TaxID=56857 RepID=A0A200QEX6_MACCD|nr:hypothetical protein BVC80_9097g139 [Macleaya cordata]